MNGGMINSVTSLHLVGCFYCFINKFANKNEDIYLQALIESKPAQNIRNHYATEESGKHKTHSYKILCSVDRASRYNLCK